ncbi:MAG: radical SAM protein [Candidatus Aminicenantes bacterium]|nr:radical SAM protein [Candidatus Aminicenantes bacterium]
MYKHIVDQNILFSLSIEITTLCNLNCVHCYNLKNIPDRLSLRHIKQVLKEASELGALFLSITGGEPMMRKDIWDVLDYAVKLNFATLLYTNGTLIGADEARMLKETGVYWVDITLLGATPSTHDKLTGCSGSFELTLNAIREIKNTGMGIAIKTPVLKENYSELNRIKNIAADLGIMHIFSPVIFPKDDGNKNPLNHRLTDKQMREYFMQHEKAARINPSGTFSCDFGKVMLAVSSQGDIHPCLNVPYPVGSIFKQSFKTIWKDSKELHQIRKNAENPCQSFIKCPYKYWCFRCEGLAWLEKKKLFVPDRESCRMAHMRKQVEKETPNKRI